MGLLKDNKKEEAGSGIHIRTGFFNRTSDGFVGSPFFICMDAAALISSRNVVFEKMKDITIRVINIEIWDGIRMHMKLFTRQMK